jgi:hypothetical protein
VEHDLFGTGFHPRIKSGGRLFPDHALLVEHEFFGKPVSTPGSSPGAGFFRIMLFLVEHDLFGKPVSTFPDHALK